MRTLIIEDDQALASVLMRRLTKHGHQCRHFDNGTQGLIECEEFSPEVILLDMKLHDDSGLKYISALRKLQPQARIILMTGYASIATAVDAIKLGADDYLAKPVDSQTLLSAMHGKKIDIAEEVETDTLTSEQYEWEHINQALKFNDGNISATARQLSMHRRTLQRKLQRRPSFAVKD
ncbi:response regulator [Thalassotalea fonticola]|uniref:Response regulator n=1 Tax=Thalassotalea fonticola TaxID=3065649 RepID=A0ABZ0GUH8_9GAMM|nr:response regulator [Colwelliaceae bacterium S1-1]